MATGFWRFLKNRKKLAASKYSLNSHKKKQPKPMFQIEIRLLWRRLKDFIS